jgi:hypothetical protein
MDFNFFENDIFYQSFNMNLDEIIWSKFKKILKDFLKIFSRIFEKYSRDISPKTIIEVVKKQAGVAHIIAFAPRDHQNQLNGV